MYIRFSSLLTILLLVICAFSCSVELSVDENNITSRGVKFNLENEVVHRYLNEVDYNSIGYDKCFILNYSSIPTEYIKSRPSPVTIQLQNNLASYDLISLFSEADKDTLNYFVEETDIKNIIVYNLIPSRHYNYSIYKLGNDGNKVLISNGIFETTGTVRMLYIDGTYNFRDMGGWRVGKNQRIKYGKLIRGAEIDYTERLNITESGIKELLDQLSVDVEIDFGDASDSSPLEQYGIDFISLRRETILGYNRPPRSIAQDAGRNLYKFFLSECIDRLVNDHVVYFHCNSGADRTGTFAFIIGALLGMSESDLRKEYELTSFYDTRVTQNVEGEYCYKTMIDYINSHYKGNTLNEKVYNMCILPQEEEGIGLTPTAVQMLRDVMIEEIK